MLAEFSVSSFEKHCLRDFEERLGTNVCAKKQDFGVGSHRKDEMINPF
jgi:hypothetical protein